MVTGNGMIAQRFSSYQQDERFLIFASGVSNSKSKNAADYDREKELLQNIIAQNKDKRLVYFSTCSIYDAAEKQSPYVLHKLSMEQTIRENALSYLIVRASNVAGRSANPNTVLNYFYYHIKQKINFDAWINARRNIIDIDDLFLITDYILQRNLFNNQIINVASDKAWSVLEIIDGIEKILNVFADYSTVEKGDSFEIDISEIKNIIRDLRITFNDDYLKRILEKNYSQ